MRYLKSSLAPAVALAAVLASGASIAIPTAAQAQNSAGFDCRKASTPTEKAICADADTAAADRAMTIAYNALVDRADPALKASLRKDQNDFLELRRQAFEVHRTTPELRAEGLRERTEERAELLNWISVVPATSLVGNWTNAWGNIEVKQDAANRLTVEFAVADQANGTWLCEFSGPLEQAEPDEAGFKGEGGPLLLRLHGAALTVPTPFCDESTSGGFGSAAGIYFRVGE